MTNMVQIQISDIDFDHYGETEITAYLRGGHPLTRNGTIAGCPMGRGMTPESAMADLQRRIQSENNVRIGWVDA